MASELPYIAELRYRRLVFLDLRSLVLYHLAQLVEVRQVKAEIKAVKAQSFELLFECIKIPLSKLVCFIVEQAILLLLV